MHLSLRPGVGWKDNLEMFLSKGSLKNIVSILMFLHSSSLKVYSVFFLSFSFCGMVSSLLKDPSESSLSYGSIYL